MSTSLKSVDAITLFIEDRHRSKSFYETVFEAPVVHEDDVAVAFKFENLIVNLLEVGAAHELIEPAAVAPAADGARYQLTIGVEDTDAVSERLRSSGVELINGPTDRPWGLRTACFADPDGHIWEIAAKIG